MEPSATRAMPLEAQRDLLIELVALKLPRLYHGLIKLYGEEQGKKIYDDLYEQEFAQRAKVFQGKDVGDVLAAEAGIFPALGWKLSVEKKEEDGEPVWYEHLQKCPHLEATRKHGLPPPCDYICNQDARLGEEHGIGRWELRSHMPSGDVECCFRIRRPASPAPAGAPPEKNQ